jgi:hypothetical protein
MFQVENGDVAKLPMTPAVVQTAGMLAPPPIAAAPAAVVIKFNVGVVAVAATEQTVPTGIVGAPDELVNDKRMVAG